MITLKFEYGRLHPCLATMSSILKNLGIIAAVTMALADKGVAELVIDVSRSYTQPMPVAIIHLPSISKIENPIYDNIVKVVSADLERSGLFRPMASKAFMQMFDSLTLQPKFTDWQLLKAQALVSCQTTVQTDGSLRIEFRLWDVFASEQLVRQVLFARTENWRRVAHVIADTVYSRLTGDDGYFDTRVVYVAESGPPTHRVKRLAIMDQDGANHSYLSDGSWLVLTPRFSPTMQEITYVSYFRNIPHVYLLNIQMGRRQLLGDFPGMTFAPRFSPDGRRIVMSMAQQGNSEIYEMDLRTRTVRQITHHPAIDTSPSYSANGLQITFNSDRSGTQQIYVMNKDGSDVQRISFGDGRYATSVWSPRGDLIAFTKFKSGRFYIGVMKPDGSGERQLAEGFLVESPTWAPNGRVLMFFREISRDAHGRGGSTRLYSVDLTGYNERLVATPQDASDPAWSSLLSLPSL
ncbi:tolB protein precursor, periplasmic protein involved in the tonb-independent uptake of group A colicins [invertebrate metagenome]|uniref:TolB protein, periplasmic protein involved in the tonb-independent uptake of group A colicins n=1 Tax=invertebrate metagenome TaxID=1711999 RepID=A0A484H7K8_9ZZZZ